MLVLGLHVGHDANATLIRDGEWLVTVEAERVLDHKHIMGGTAAKVAADRALRSEGLSPADVDAVVVADAAQLKFDLAPGVPQATHHEPFLCQLPSPACHALLQEALDLPGLRPAVPLFLACHSIAHAAGGLYMSGYDSCALLVYDGYGTCCGTMAYQYAGNRLRPLDHWRDRFLMGLRYSAFGWFLQDIEGSQFLDFAGKVMGLNAYGKPRPAWVDGFRRWFLDTDPAHYDRCLVSYFDHPLDFVPPPGELGRPGLYVDRLSARDQDSLDVIASMQEAFSGIVTEALAELVRETGAPRVVVSGGCGLNIVANQRIAAMPQISELFIPPNCDDRGLSLGAAVLGASALSGRPLHHPGCAADRRSPYRGMPLIDDVPNQPEGVAVTPFPPQEVAAEMAEMIARGQIIGLVQGRCEIGPRALGNRSILANAADPHVKDNINQKIKRREWWRPFAPVCRAVDVAEYFLIDRPDPYMLIGATVRAGYAARLPGITHVDGSARVQTLADRAVNPLLWDVITALKERTGIGVVLNTSFNVGGKPLANRLSAVTDLLLTTQLDAVWLAHARLTKAAG